MTQGVLIFAFNSEGVDYVKMAILSARCAKKFLNKPVSLVTDSRQHLMENFPNDVDVFDKIIGRCFYVAICFFKSAAKNGLVLYEFLLCA